MIGKNKAIESAKMIVKYCEEQRSCQNCIFRMFFPDKWECNIKAFDLAEVLSNAEAKTKHHGYI